MQSSFLEVAFLMTRNIHRYDFKTTLLRSWLRASRNSSTKTLLYFKCLGLSQYKSNQSLHGDWKNSYLVEFGKSLREFV